MSSISRGDDTSSSIGVKPVVGGKENIDLRGVLVVGKRIGRAFRRNL
jgi:hypothetical protein